MNDPTPPPELPMDEATRARVRARLAEATAARGGPAPGIRPWLAPVGAAAAVLLIAAGAGYAAFWPGGDVAAPAEQTSATASDGPVPTPSPPPPSPSPTEPEQNLQPSPTLPPTQPATGPAPMEYCAAAVAEQLKGAEQVVAWPLPKGESGIWVAGDRSVLCEDSGGIATTHRAGPVTGSLNAFPEELAVSSSTYFMDERQALTAYVAGGPLPAGVTGIDYRFPDGHVERAVFRTDDAGREWWSVGYVPYDGIMADPRTNSLDLPPLQVTVALSGTQESYTLDWALNMCAQVNHGC